MTILDEIKKKITIDKCRWCGSELNKDNIDMYPHEGGWIIDGMSEKQWLYIHCNKCDYDWPIWKLGVPME